MPEPKPHRLTFEPLRWAAEDPLEQEHQLVAQLVSQTLASGWTGVGEIDFETTNAGQQILHATPELSARLVLALTAHAGHADRQITRLRALAQTDLERSNPHLMLEWNSFWMPRRIVVEAFRQVMKRKLPLRGEHLITMADWIATEHSPHEHWYPLKGFVKAVEAHGAVEPAEGELRTALARVATLLRNSRDKDILKLGQRLEAMLATAGEAGTADSSKAGLATEVCQPDASQPAPVGSPQVLVSLKKALGILPHEPATGTEAVRLDRFAFSLDSPLQAEHELINRLLPEVMEFRGYHDPPLAKMPTGQVLLSGDTAALGRVVVAVAERCTAIFFNEINPNDLAIWQSHHALGGLIRKLLAQEVTFERDGLFDVLLLISAVERLDWHVSIQKIDKLLGVAKEFASSAPLTPGERHVLHRLRCQLVRTAPFGRSTPEVAQIDRLLGDGVFLALVPGESWSEAVNAELTGMNAATRALWLELLRHAASATGSRPSAKWLKSGRDHLKRVGNKAFGEALLRWFPLVSVPNPFQRLRLGMTASAQSLGSLHDDNATCLRGLLWLSPEAASADLIRGIGGLTVSCYRKVPGVGPRAVKAGNAGVYALSQINDPLAVGQLALLKVKVKFGSAQKEIEKAFTLAAERSGLPREELEEMSIPTYGLTDVGVCEEKFGHYTARLTITGTDSTELTWIKPDGKVQRSVPAEVKAAQAGDLKELQAAAKDIQKMLPAQRERIDSLFLQQRTWPLDVWRDPSVGELVFA